MTSGPDSSNCNSLYVVFEIDLLGFMATVYAYLILMPASLLLASVNSVNSNHIGTSACLLAMTLSNTLNIAVSRINWSATFGCCQMC